MSQFEISDQNPNETVGGGGCLGNGEEKSVDCTGPFIVFYASETSSNSSPHAVLCASCLAEVITALGEGEQEQPVIDLPPENVVEELDAEDSVPEV